MPCQIVISVSDISQVGEARRIVARHSSAAKLSDAVQGKLAIITTELATNLVRHAGQGRLLLQEVTTAAGSVTELISIDSGPGIANVEKALTDGFSTGGTAGNGLGAIRRLADEFDIYSQAGQGTVIVARVARGAWNMAAPSDLVWGAVSIPAPHETECGDTWVLSAADQEFSLMVVDGLGHGPLAAEAAQAAVAAFAANSRALPGCVLQAAHQKLSGTRGAAVAVACLPAGQKTLKYAGIGNISGTLVSGDDRSGLVSHNGIVGSQRPKIQEFDYACRDRDILVMHSDGLQSRWTFQNYPGLRQRHPAVIAGLLYRDFVRGRDDVTVVVVRFGSTKA